MYRIQICRTVGERGSVILSETLACLHRPEVPDDLDEMVEELGGDYCNIEELDDDED